MTSDQPAGQQMVIWGTNVVVTETKDKFQRFVERFTDPDADASEGINPHEPLYLQKLEEVMDICSYCRIHWKYKTDYSNILAVFHKT